MVEWQIIAIKIMARQRAQIMNRQFAWRYRWAAIATQLPV